MWVHSKYLTQALYSTIYKKKKYKKYHRNLPLKIAISYQLPKKNNMVVFINIRFVRILDQFFNKFQYKLKRAIKFVCLTNKFIYFPFRITKLMTKKAKDIRMGRGKGMPITYLLYAKQAKLFLGLYVRKNWLFFFIISKLKKIFPNKITELYKYSF